MHTREVTLRSMIHSCFTHSVSSVANSEFVVRHHNEDLKYDSAQWSCDARRRSTRFESEPLLLAIKQAQFLQTRVGSY